jgi:serine/threonine protein kinase
VIYEGQHLDIINPDVLPFRPIKHLGMGGSASVEMIQLTTNGWQFAHKVFRKVHGQRLDEAKRNFRNEIEVIKRLSPHPHIIRVFATYTCGRTLGMLLAPVADNGDLGTYLQMILDSENSPTTEQTTILEGSFGCLANGLAFIHKHTIRHKDIKPQNILIHKGRVIYTDFGIALDASQKENTTTVGNPGAFTRRYCAPEVAIWENRNRKSDVFSLGCVFIDVLAVLEPQIKLREFEAYCYREIINDLRNILRHKNTIQPSRGPLLRICHDMLGSKPEDRISSKTLLEKMNLLWRPSSDTGFKCFCDGCAPKPEQQKADPTTGLLSEQQSSSQFTGTPVSSISPSGPFQPHDGKITLEHLTIDPDRSKKRKRRKRGNWRNKEKIIESWGSRENFQASYGLGMTLEDLQEGDAILQEMMRLDRLPPDSRGP